VARGYPRLVLGDDEHRPYEDFAVRHVMGALDEAEASTFRSHLLDCAECRARVGELRSIASDLAEVERAERRERAAKLVETKERELDEDDEGLSYEEPRRSSRVLAIGGVLLIVVLSIWNFVLRGQNESLRDYAGALQASAEVVNFGDAWATEELALGVEGIARVESGHLAVMVRGTDDASTYQLERYDADGELLDTEALESVDGQIRYYRAVPAETHRVDVTLDRMNGETVVFRAVAEPADRAAAGG
jgi:hypothetical protein